MIITMQISSIQNKFEFHFNICHIQSKKKKNAKNNFSIYHLWINCIILKKISIISYEVFPHNSLIPSLIHYLMGEEHGFHAQFSTVKCRGHLYILRNIDAVPVTFDLRDIGMNKRLAGLHDPDINLTGSYSQ